LVMFEHEHHAAIKIRILQRWGGYEKPALGGSRSNQHPFIVACWDTRSERS
jgi:hypothetical protein